MRTWTRRLAFVVSGLLLAGTSHGYFLDGDRRFDVRLRAYSQLGIMTEDSQPQWANSYDCRGNTGAKPNCHLRVVKPYNAGDLAQQRNFYNPEFDAKLTDFTGGYADDLKFHFAWWGFYDGLYDYLNPVWRDNARNLRSRQSETDSPAQSLAFNDQNKNPRHIYASRNRINELYLDYTKGRVFFRVGRQAISWGESDDIALLDVQNPFDLTLGAPGFFQDVEEARIPLYTARGTVKLVDSWKWLSSFFLDSYLVPGPIETTVPIDPMTGGASPFSPDQPDAQVGLDNTGLVNPNAPVNPVTNPARGRFIHVVQASRKPEHTWGNSRWGARLTGVLARDYTVQAWVFRTFNQAPVGWLQGPPGAFALGAAGKFTLVDNRGFRTPACFDATGQPIAKTFGSTGRTAAGRRCSYAAPALALLERRLETVFGLAATWFSPTVNGIIRTEAEFFKDELASIPDQNLNAGSQVPGATVGNALPKANFLRWVIGYDRFFFFRPLNPSNSFILSTAMHGQWNVTGVNTDYRTAVVKPGKSQQSACPNDPNNALCVTTLNKNYQDQYQVDNLFLQVALLTDYMHGRLTPRLVMITDVSGIFAFAPSLTYRITDNFLASATYLAVQAPRYYNLGFFRGHDMLQLRMTYQIN